MIFYRRRPRHQVDLAKKGAAALQSRKCPHCREELTLAEIGKDRDMYLCAKCGDVATFTRLPFEEPKTKKLNTLTLRDRTTKAYKHCESANKAASKNVPKEVNSVLKKIRKGMKESVVIGFDYEDTGGKVTERIVEPYKLTIKGGNIVLFGYDIEVQGIRIFKLCNIASVADQPYSFKPRWDVEDYLKDASDD